MQIDVHKERKLVCIWLARLESEDAGIQEKLKNLYAQYKQQGYLVAVYHSGDQDLQEMTSALLQYNRRLFAEREVQAEKENAILQM